MDNFEFYNPTKILFGQGMIAKLDEQLDSQARVLILYGGASAEKNGTLGEVRKALGKRSFCEFGGIEANPTYETLMKAVDVARKEKVDFLLAVGGLFPRLARQLTDAALAGQKDEVARINTIFAPFWEMSARYGGSLRVIASAAEIMGLAGAHALPRPLKGVSAQDAEQLASLIKTHQPG